MEIKTIINSIGILLNIIGVYLVYINSPINKHSINAGNASTDFSKLKKASKKKNNLLKTGVYIVLLGSFFQLISNFVQV